MPRPGWWQQQIQMALAKQQRHHARLKKRHYQRTKPREIWTEQEHSAFVNALQLFGRDWPRVTAAVGTKTRQQTCSHAQTHFKRIVHKNTGELIPPPDKRTQGRANIPPAVRESRGSQPSPEEEQEEPQQHEQDMDEDEDGMRDTSTVPPAGDAAAGLAAAADSDGAGPAAAPPPPAGDAAAGLAVVAAVVAANLAIIACKQI
jgi:SHAQKYF class myb-like DNA-binding protein